MTAPNKRRLTRQDRIFADLAIKNGLEHLDECALEAGFSPSTARFQAPRILRKQCVQSYVYKTINQACQQLGIDDTWKLQKLKTIIEKFIDENGEFGVNEARTAITAIAEINKMDGTYAETEKNIKEGNIIDAEENADEKNIVLQTMDKLSIQYDKEF